MANVITRNYTRIVKVRNFPTKVEAEFWYETEKKDYKEQGYFVYGEPENLDDLAPWEWPPIQQEEDGTYSASLEVDKEEDDVTQVA